MLQGYWSIGGLRMKMEDNIMTNLYEDLKKLIIKHLIIVPKADLNATMHWRHKATTVNLRVKIILLHVWVTNAHIWILVGYFEYVRCVDILLLWSSRRDWSVTRLFHGETDLWRNWSVTKLIYGESDLSAVTAILYQSSQSEVLATTFGGPRTWGQTRLSLRPDRHCCLTKDRTPWWIYFCGTYSSHLVFGPLTVVVRP